MAGPYTRPISSSSFTAGATAGTTIIDALSSGVERLEAAAYNVKDYGAVGDALPITASITSGSATLNISGSTFPTSGVVGKTVVVTGAGASGVPLIATISTRNSSTQVVLSATASTTSTTSPTA